MQWRSACWPVGFYTEPTNRFNGLSQGHDHEIDGGVMLIVAVTGLLINLFAAWTLYRSSGHKINVEGAFWHIVADLAGSIALVISSVIVLIFDWDLVDPVLSVFIGILVMAGSCRLAMKVFRILLEVTPPGLDLYLLCSKIEDSEGVTLVHDVHALDHYRGLQRPRNLAGKPTFSRSSILRRRLSTVW